MDGDEGDNLGILPARPRREAMDGGGLRLAAPAKLNLDLYVGARAGDGYHGLDSIVVKVTLYDEIVLRPRADGRLTFRCEGADCGPRADNLAWRAAGLLREAAGARAGGAGVLLTKSIPPGQGLGGGSSDAAAVLDGLDQLWRTGLGAERLAELGGRLGSDVPLFLGPPAARMTGRGERIAPAAVGAFVAVMHLPEFACSTGEVYRRFDRLADQAGRLPTSRPALAQSPPSAWRAEMTNQLAPAAMAVSDPLRARWELLSRSVELPVAITGSGSAMFILCDDANEAAAVVRHLPADLPGQTIVVRPNPW